jgi:hypothetical protein
MNAHESPMRSGRSVWKVAVCADADKPLGRSVTLSLSYVGADAAVRLSNATPTSRPAPERRPATLSPAITKL